MLHASMLKQESAELMQNVARDHASGCVDSGQLIQ